MFPHALAGCVNCGVKRDSSRPVDYVSRLSLPLWPRRPDSRNVWPLQVVVPNELAALADGKHRPLTGEQSVVYSTFQASRARATSVAERVGDLLLQMTNKLRALDAVRSFVDDLDRALLLNPGSSRGPLPAAISGLGEKARDEGAIAGTVAAGAAGASASGATAGAAGASAADAAACAAGASAAGTAAGAAGASVAGVPEAAAEAATTGMTPSERACAPADGPAESLAVQPEDEAAVESAGLLAGEAAGKMARDWAGDSVAMKTSPSTGGSLAAAVDVTTANSTN